MIKGGNDVLLDTAAIVVGAGLVALPFLFLVPLPAPASWPYILASVATHVAYYYLMINAYRTGELSLVYPLMRGVAPLLTGVIAIVWMDEWPGAVGLGGHGVDFVGSFCAGLPPGTRSAGPCKVMAAPSALRWPMQVSLRFTPSSMAAAPGSLATPGRTLCGSSCSTPCPSPLYMLVTRGPKFARALGARRRAA